MAAKLATIEQGFLRFAVASALWGAMAVIGCSNGSGSTANGGSSGDPDAENPGGGGSSDSLSIEPIAAEDFEKFLQDLQQPPWVLSEASAIVNIERAFEYHWSILDEDGNRVTETTAPYACDLFVDQTAIFSFYPSPDDDGFSLLRRNDGAVFWSLTYFGEEWSGSSGAANADQFRGNCSVIADEYGQKAICVFGWVGEASESQSSPPRKSDADIEIMCAYGSLVRCEGSSLWDSDNEECVWDGNRCTFDICLPNGECEYIDKEQLTSNPRCYVSPDLYEGPRCCYEGSCIPCTEVPQPDAVESP